MSVAYAFDARRYAAVPEDRGRPGLALVERLDVTSTHTIIAAIRRRATRSGTALIAVATRPTTPVGDAPDAPIGVRADCAVGRRSAP